MKGNLLVPMIFPIIGKVHWSDSFAPNGENGRRTHHGQDVMAAKMCPLLAAFDGVVYVIRSSGVGGHNRLTLVGDHGLTAEYMHINNDTPGTNDGLGTEDYAFAPGLRSGDRVVAGQILAWVGNSGNAEKVGPHLHFELWDSQECLNPDASLRQATRLTAPLVKLAAPALKPKAGEIRLDGCVRSVDTAASLLVLDLLSQTQPNGKTTSILKPERRWVKLSKAELQRRDDSMQSLTVAELQPGQLVTVLGEDKGRAKAMAARLAAFETPTTRDPFDPTGTPDPGVPDPGTTLPADTDVSTPAPKPSEPAEPPKLNTSEWRLAQAINAYRAKNELPELTLSAPLIRAARQHSEDMAEGDFTDHVSPDGSRVEDRIQKKGYRAERVRETIARGPETPDDALTEWTARNRDSRAILNDPALREVGVGYVTRMSRKTGRAEHLWTAVFAVPRKTPSKP